MIRSVSLHYLDLKLSLCLLLFLPFVCLSHIIIFIIMIIFINAGGLFSNKFSAIMLYSFCKHQTLRLKINGVDEISNFIDMLKHSFDVQQSLAGNFYMVKRFDLHVINTANVYSQCMIALFACKC